MHLISALLPTPPPFWPYEPFQHEELDSKGKEALACAFSYYIRSGAASFTTLYSIRYVKPTALWQVLSEAPVIA